MKRMKKHRREIVFFLDLFIITFTGCILFTMEEFTSGCCSGKFIILYPHLVLLLACQALSQYVFKTYDSLWRYAECKEYLTLMIGSVVGYLCFFLVDYLLLKSEISILFSLTVFALALLGMLFMRLSYRLYRRRKKYNNDYERIPLVIIGAGEAGVKLLEEVKNNPNSRYKTVCFVDDSIEKIGKSIHNIEVKGPITDLNNIIKDCPTCEIVIAMPSVVPEKCKEIVKICSEIKCRVRILPDTMTLLQNKKELWSNIREMKIEELLGREPVILEDIEVIRFLQDKVVMVTGGGGSIGSELCRQIAKLRPKKLIILDIYENNAYDIQQELHQIYGTELELKVEIASIRDKEKINLLMKRYRPNIIFHAAAHKHVPLMEDCPEEAIKNNIIGTYHLVHAADQYKVDKFVQISTDKAVNPTSVMGASKRFCEMILQSMKERSKTEFVAVRFGNVIGSNGSVVPLFQKQIARGGPVTITDRRIVRYFMTISEAVQLVLQAGAMANSSEIYILDMGHAVSILELAENLIRLSGYMPYTEIPIVEMGMRPGEKLYEELLMQGEELMKTSNHKIYIERQKGISKEELEEKLEILIKSMKTGSTTQMKEALKSVIPTYRDPDEVNREKAENKELPANSEQI